MNPYRVLTRRLHLLRDCSTCLENVEKIPGGALAIPCVPLRNGKPENSPQKGRICEFQRKHPITASLQAVPVAIDENSGADCWRWITTFDSGAKKPGCKRSICLAALW